MNRSKPLTEGTRRDIQVRKPPTTPRPIDPPKASRPTSDTQAQQYQDKEKNND